MHQIGIIGAPSSAGAYAPGQEKTPGALREAGLLALLSGAGFQCLDLGDVTGFRWEADPSSPLAMNIGQVGQVAREVAARVADAHRKALLPLVVGGDCTVEFGTVAGTLASAERLGLIYFDLDTDLNTPETTTDGALDWMGVAHLLDLPGSVGELAALGPRRPMLAPSSIFYLGVKNIEPAEAATIERLGIESEAADTVSADPAAAAKRALDWASRFDKILIHFDVDVIDFEDFPLAENVRRKCGISFKTAIQALAILLGAGNLAGLTICEINPDHGRLDGSTLAEFCQRLARAFAEGEALRSTRGNP